VWSVQTNFSAQEKGLLTHIGSSTMDMEPICRFAGRKGTVRSILKPVEHLWFLNVIQPLVSLMKLRFRLKLFFSLIAREGLQWWSCFYPHHKFLILYALLLKITIITLIYITPFIHKKLKALYNTAQKKPKFKKEKGTAD